MRVKVIIFKPIFTIFKFFTVIQIKDTQMWTADKLKIVSYSFCFWLKFKFEIYVLFIFFCHVVVFGLTTILGAGGRLVPGWKDDTNFPTAYPSYK